MTDSEVEAYSAIINATARNGGYHLTYVELLSKELDWRQAARQRLVLKENCKHEWVRNFEGCCFCATCALYMEELTLQTRASW